MLTNYDVGVEKPTTTYEPSHPYDDKLNLGLQVPRLLVPPPVLRYEHGRASFHVDSVDFERQDTRCGSPSFLRAVASTYPLTLEHTINKWDYEHRRSVQSVLPFLLIGPSCMARDQSFVESSGITFLLAVRSAHTVSKYPRYLDPSRFPSAAGLATAVFDLDTPYELITNIRPVVKTINDHLEASCIQPGERSSLNIRAKVLVFCETGNERSAVVVAAYLMFVYGIKAFQAIQVVQSQRFCINVDDGMRQMLSSLEDIIAAERGVAASYSEQNIKTVAKSFKRNIDDAYDGDDDHSTPMGLTANGHQHYHPGMPPFKDILP